MGKRLFDICISCIGLIASMPILLILFLGCGFFFRGKFLFKQSRPGKNGKPFVMVKFCTMLDLRDSNGDLLPDDQRMTRFGAFLRATSLDELPELYNVLKGDMSLVGPRPLLMEYLPLYDSFQARRHEVRPGITGWAQINGRNAISWEEKFQLDVWYVDNASILLDIKILFMTVLKVFRREGISSDGHVTSQKFTGKS